MMPVSSSGSYVNQAMAGFTVIPVTTSSDGQIMPITVIPPGGQRTNNPPGPPSGDNSGGLPKYEQLQSNAQNVGTSQASGVTMHL